LISKEKGYCYNPLSSFIKEDFIEFKKEVEDLSSKIKAYLNKMGYI
jgi:hypothetical protein